MKKRIISMAMSVVVAISALPLFSSCSGGIGGTNINQELVKNLELDQNDISILVKPFEVIGIARNELNSKSNITNEDLQNFSNTIYDAFTVQKITKVMHQIFPTRNMLQIFYRKSIVMLLKITKQ